MSDHKPEAINQESLTNDEIVTGRKVARRAFLTATGMLLAGGAALMVAGARGAAQDSQSDPDKAKGSDPDKKKKSSKMKSKKAKSSKESDPDKAKPPSQ